LCIDRPLQRRYLLNLVQENRKGIEAAAQHWREGSKTDSQLMQVLQVLHAAEAFRAWPLPSSRPAQSSGGDVLAELLDAEQVTRVIHAILFEFMLSVQGSQVRDTGIFRAHAARYEAEFLEDMTRLGEMMRNQTHPRCSPLFFRLSNA
jgi:hypothetical protein